ncbi:MAG: 1-deoxy-D-xylulose-5-phosphate synthase [Bacteroidales bacterium]|nr:1-deoxy-D-xylulose-5-phosphate synthase [Bacteroidales bacterium]
MAILENINSPADLKGLGNEELRTLCAELRSYIIECCSRNPGHLGASLGAVEIAVAIHKVFDTPQDKVVWDVGHQAYAHKIITGRREAFLRNRCLDGISGFPKMSESPYDSFGAGHSSVSVSAALGIAAAEKLSGKGEHVVAVIGDGAMTGGLAFEGLNNAGASNADLLVIFNDNQISIDDNTGGLHNYLVRLTTSAGYNRIKKSVWDRLGQGRVRKALQRLVKGMKRAIVPEKDRVNFFDSLGFRYFGPIDGNNIETMVETLSRLKNIPGPKLLHVVTLKGKGYAPAEADPTVWHAPGRFDPATGERILSKGGAAKYQTVFGTTLLELARADSRIVGVTPAMATGCGMDIMMRELPGRVFDVGIAEQHAVTFSAGLAAGGLLPFCNIYSSFSQRAFDNLIHDVALQNLKVVICLDRAGIVGEDGATHHGAFDMACYRPIPNLTIAAPLNETELRDMMYSATLPEYDGPIIIRYPRGAGAGAPWKDEPFHRIARGKAVKLSEGSSVAVLSIGTVGNKAAGAVRQAADQGINALHFDMRFLKPLDEEALAEACAKASRIITVEDGVTAGGLFGAVSEYVASHCGGQKPAVTGLGIGDRFVEQGKPEELYRECGYSESDILRAILGDS